MYCIYCGHKYTKVVDKRDLGDNCVSRRRRECSLCQKRFTTYERVERHSIKVVKKDGSVVDYDREKLFNSVLLAVQKRVSLDKVHSFIDDIEMQLFSKKTNEIASSELGRLVLKGLRGLDKVSYMRFASVFLDFENLDAFREEIKRIK